MPADAIALRSPQRALHQAVWFKFLAEIVDIAAVRARRGTRRFSATRQNNSSKLFMRGGAKSLIVIPFIAIARRVRT
jgi:hypothetical protein